MWLTFLFMYRNSALLTDTALTIKLNPVAVNFKISCPGKLKLVQIVVIHILNAPTGDTNQMMMRDKIAIIPGVGLIESHNKTSGLKGIERIIHRVR